MISKARFYFIYAPNWTSKPIEPLGLLGHSDHHCLVLVNSHKTSPEPRKGDKGTGWARETFGQTAQAFRNDGRQKQQQQPLRNIRQQTFEKQFFHFACGGSGEYIFLCIYVYLFFLVLWHFKSSTSPTASILAFYTRLAWKFIKKLCLTCQTKTAAVAAKKEMQKTRRTIFAKFFIAVQRMANGIFVGLTDLSH